MLAFGRGIFTATVISTFFLLLIAFYPAEIQGNLHSSGEIKSTIARESYSNMEIDANDIIELCSSANIPLPIKKIAIEDEQMLDIHYGIDLQSKDYGFINSYKLANLLFAKYNQIDTIRYTVMLQNKPYFRADIVRDNRQVLATGTKLDSKQLLTEIQRTFTITLLDH